MNSYNLMQTVLQIAIVNVRQKRPINRAELIVKQMEAGGIVQITAPFRTSSSIKGIFERASRFDSESPIRGEGTACRPHVTSPCSNRPAASFYGMSLYKWRLIASKFKKLFSLNYWMDRKRFRNSGPRTGRRTRGRWGVVSHSGRGAGPLIRSISSIGPEVEHCGTAVISSRRGYY